MAFDKQYGGRAEMEHPNLVALAHTQRRVEQMIGQGHVTIARAYRRNAAHDHGSDEHDRHPSQTVAAVDVDRHTAVPAEEIGDIACANRIHWKIVPRHRANASDFASDGRVDAVVVAR